MRTVGALLLGLGVGASAWAYDYPTVDRVEFVLECMQNYGGEYRYIYQCSCTIDAIARELPYEAYVDTSTVARYQGMGGEGAGVFRDSDEVREMAKRYRSVRSAAFKQCGITEKKR
jgi:hypothetical protein